MIKVVFESPNFIICDKESGVLSTPSRYEDNDERSCLGTLLQEQLQIQIFPIHRLDFEVSGLVMYAKTAEAHRDANAWFEHKQVQKTYRAFTSNQGFAHIPSNIVNPRTFLDLNQQSHFEWKALLLKGKKRAYESPHGKPSLTLARYLGKNSNGFLEWDLQPVTGRSHQLRFEMSRHGFPIIGDKLYGSVIEWRESSIALRSYRIDFPEKARAKYQELPPAIEVSAL